MQWSWTTESDLVLTICSGDGFFSSGQPESSAVRFDTCSLFLLTVCDNSVRVTASFLDLSTPSTIFFLAFFCRFSTSSPAVLQAMALSRFGGLSAVTEVQLTGTLQQQ